MAKTLVPELVEEQQSLNQLFFDRQSNLSCQIDLQEREIRKHSDSRGIVNE